jgi:protein-S-isoprenylcysteine O-methyltransferase Ste14
MRFLNWNQKKVQNLTPWEIWGFIAGRVLMSFGLGVLAMQSWPQIAGFLGIPSLAIGLALLVFAAKGLRRKAPAKIRE